MSSTATVTKLEQGKNVVTIYGKIRSFRKEKAKQTKEDFFISLITLPTGGDEFASPQTVEVLSSEKLGAAGEVVTVQCSIGGYSRSFNRTDEDGVITKHWTADNVFRAV